MPNASQTGEQNHAAALVVTDEPETPFEPPVRKLSPAFQAHFFKPGQSGNPLGPRKGFHAGRQAAVALLDSILSEEETKAAMRAALRRYILQRPVAAFKTLVMPLLPKDVRVDVSSQRVVVWRSFLDEVGVKPVESAEIRTARIAEPKEADPTG